MLQHHTNYYVPGDSRERELLYEAGPRMLQPWWTMLVHTSMTLLLDSTRGAACFRH